jgi:hypothetical protein
MHIVNLEKGFEINYEMDTCAELKTEASGSIQSAGYPNFNNILSHCFWIISIEPGMKIQLSITDLSLPTSTCDTANVRVFNGGGVLRKVFKVIL